MDGSTIELLLENADDKILKAAFAQLENDEEFLLIGDYALNIHQVRWVWLKNR